MNLLKVFKVLNKMRKKAGADVSNIIIIVIGLVIAIALIPIVVQSVNSVIPNLTGASLILIGLVTFIFVAGIIVLMVKKMF